MDFPNSAKLDLNKIVAGGHSFGGRTAVGVAIRDERVKAIIPTDPWFFPDKND